MQPNLRKAKILPTIRVKVKETGSEIVINLSDFNPKRFEPANAEEAKKVTPVATKPAPAAAKSAPKETKPAQPQPKRQRLRKLKKSRRLSQLSLHSPEPSKSKSSFTTWMLKMKITGSATENRV